MTAGESAALWEEHVQFGRGPIQFVMTRVERKEWERIRNEAEADAFIYMFWARREPAYLRLFDRAVADADERLPARNQRRGSMTDMGRVLIILGSPSRQKKYEMPVGTGATAPKRYPGRVRNGAWRSWGTPSHATPPAPVIQENMECLPLPALGSTPKACTER